VKRAAANEAATPNKRPRVVALGDTRVFHAAMQARGITGFLEKVCAAYSNYIVANVPANPERVLVAALGGAEQYDAFVERDRNAGDQRVTRGKVSAGESPADTAAAQWRQHDTEVRIRHESEMRKAILKQKVSQDQMMKNKLNLLFVHVGQGDCTFIRTPGERNVMIDCGTAGGIDACGAPFAPKDWPAVMDHILGAKAHAEALDVLILTHPDKDHHNGVKQVAERCFPRNIKRIYHSNELGHYIDNTILTSNYLRNVPDVSIKRTRLTDTECTVARSKPRGIRPGDVPKRDDDVEWLDEHGALVIVKEPLCTIRILASEVGLTDTNYTQAGARNTGSVVTLVEAYGKRILICGDATSQTERFLLDKYRATLLAPPLDILRCSHHGSDEDCNVERFATALDAKEVIVSAAQMSQPLHGLPAIAILQRYWSQAGTTDAEHNVWYWYKHSAMDKTRVNDNLYETTLPDVVPNRDAYKKKTVWTTGSNGTLIRSFPKAT
jgi:beta-lactamase superfamily II metal-dependent hydrolase